MKHLVGWRSVLGGSGALCVMIIGTIEMLLLSVDNLESVQLVSHSHIIYLCRIPHMKLVSFTEATALHYATFGQGDGAIFLDNVYCIGNETRLADCQHQGIASHDCSHYEDAGVVCPGE